MKMLFSKKQISGNETGPWHIKLIENGLRCVHESGNFTEYFEADELAGINAFGNQNCLTPLNVFQRMMLKTPVTKGFIYRYWSLIRFEDKGFIIKPRLSEHSSDIEEYKDYVKEERYRTNESLREISMIDFLKYLEEKKSENPYDNDSV